MIPTLPADFVEAMFQLVPSGEGELETSQGPLPLTPLTPPPPPMTFLPAGQVMPS
jgi:hypothetical protein